MYIIGELINGMYQEVGGAIKNKDKSVIQRLAKEQVSAGANALDLNCGPVSKDQVADMAWLVQTVNEVTDAPLCLDSTRPGAIVEGLKFIKGRSIINSTTADQEKLDILVPLAIKHKSYLIGLTMDKKGVPQDKDRRLELAARIVADCQEKGFPIEDLYIDPVVLPVNVAQNQAKAVLEVLKEFKILCDPPPKTVVGLSNISQGTCKRNMINRTFLTMALGAGLDAAILDVLDKELMDSLITSELVMNKQIYCDSYLEAYLKK